MKRDTIFFDHNSTTPLLNAVKEAMLDMMGPPMNASSLHHFGRASKTILETARSRIINFSGASSDYNVIFTSTGTESNNLALRALINIQTICSTIEHPSVTDVANNPIVSVLKNGCIDMEALEKICAAEKQPFLISIMAANNETGVIQPIKEAAKIIHKYGGIMHTDATQAFGKIPFDILDADLDMVTISAHKFGGPLGAAALIIKKNLNLQPIMKGGGQEYRYRPGTQNLPAIHGFGVAAEIACSNIYDFSKLAELRNYIENQIQSFCPTSIVFGGKADRLPNTLSINMPGVPSETQVIHFDINGFAVSAGAACSSGRVEIPRVQMNMGYNEEEAKTCLRISLGLNNNINEIKSFVKVWYDLYNNSIKINKVV